MTDEEFITAIREMTKECQSTDYPSGGTKRDTLKTIITAFKNLDGSCNREIMPECPENGSFTTEGRRRDSR